MADELFQRFAEAASVKGLPLAEELQNFSELGRVGEWPTWLGRIGVTKVGIESALRSRAHFGHAQPVDRVAYGKGASR